MPDNLSQPIPPVPSAPTPMLPAPPPLVTPPVVPPAGGSNKFKIGLAILILFLISVSIPAAVWLTSQRQEVRKEAQGEICCRVEAKNLCTPGFGSWDMTVDSFATEAECDAYIANSTFSYSCNCCATCTSGGSPDNNQTCGNETACPGTVKQRCSSSGSDLRKVIVNQAACVGPTPTTPTQPTPTSTPPVQNTPTPTLNPSGTPQPTATPTPSISCLTCKAYDTNWNQIMPSSIQLGQTVYFATQGSTNHPQGITKARFRVNGGNWQETTNKHGEFFYIQYTVSSAGSYTVESMVYNSALGWY